jgi:hypothetical protein
VGVGHEILDADLRMPYPGGSVPRSRGDSPAVWRPRHTFDSPGVGVEDDDLGAGFGIPDPDCSVVRRGGQPPLLRRPRQPPIPSSWPRSTAKSPPSWMRTARLLSIAALSDRFRRTKELAVTPVHRKGVTTSLISVPSLEGGGGVVSAGTPRESVVALWQLRGGSAGYPVRWAGALGSWFCAGLWRGVVAVVRLEAE